ncbi:hypothetical protein MUN89_16640 [Halobacillus salinarum]|uniref:Uncharacterized protein n=1 Tax=Halobacillus salinarum TaxID=2932257 RepID=A0ABY4EHH6_9BACI|nr:hypothetical protein [Halobacillus salinarum]UOQ43527.1 hypothetical protein MUN89_16640 [Halobacillus salinarum]
MDKNKKRRADEGKDKYELDVDRMINEGMAAGMTRSVYGREQIGETHPIPEQEDRS